MTKMTREEARENLEKLAVLYEEAAEQSRMVDYSVIIETLKFASSNLRPITKEQNKKIFSGCDLCRGAEKVIGLVYAITEKGKEQQRKAYYVSEESGMSTWGKLRYCPACGSPVTDETVDLH